MIALVRFESGQAPIANVIGSHAIGHMHKILSMCFAEKGEKSSDKDLQDVPETKGWLTSDYCMNRNCHLQCSKISLMKESLNAYSLPEV